MQGFEHLSGMIAGSGGDRVVEGDFDGFEMKLKMLIRGTRWWQRGSDTLEVVAEAANILLQVSGLN